MKRDVELLHDMVAPKNAIMVYCTHAHKLASLAIGKMILNHPESLWIGLLEAEGPYFILCSHKLHVKGGPKISGFFENRSDLPCIPFWMVDVPMDFTLW